jgi:hypothetical protein
VTGARRDGAMIELAFAHAEARLLGDTARQVADLLDAESARPGADAGPPRDPAVRRLLPDAYPDDADAAAEFRRYTAGDLGARKIAGARAIAEAVRTNAPAGDADADRRRDDPVVVRLEPAEATTWLRSLTDLRLVLADRLGIRSDDDAVPDDLTGAVYQWLGELQWRLVELIEDGEPADGRDAREVP